MAIKNIKSISKSLKSNNRGATAIEYAVIAAVISVAIIPSVKNMAEAHFGEESGYHCTRQVLKNSDSSNSGPTIIFDGKGACGKFETKTGTKYEAGGD